mgnify:FL=1
MIQTASLPDRDEIAALLEPGGLEVVYQPIVLLLTGQVIGHEALARFPSLPDLEVDDVFAAAHAHGLGSPLEAAAIRTALANRPDDAALSLNVSVRGLGAAEVWNELPEDMHGLVVEITEDELFFDDGKLGAALDTLRRRKALIAVDDAGAGYSGLLQLLRVRPDIVKLDRALVTGVSADAARAALVASFASFATQTGGAVCAEGIEEFSDLRAIAELDISYAQGNLLGEPSSQPHRESEAGATVAARLDGGLRAFSVAERDPDLSSLGGSVPERLATMIATAANADRVDLWRLSARGDELIAVRVPDQAPGTRVPLAEFPARAHAVATGNAGQVLAADMHGEPVERRLLARIGHRSVLLVPLTEGGVVRGLVACYRRRTAPWSREAVARVRARAAPLVSVLRSGPADPSAEDV